MATIAIRLGSDYDPWIRATAEQIMWFTELWLSASMAARLRIKIHRLKTRTHITGADRAKRWKRVTGPIGAVIACLAEIGWNPHWPATWYDRENTKWSMEDYTPEHMYVKPMALLQAVSRDAMKTSCRACPSHADNGLDHGADWRQVTLRVAQLRGQDRAQKPA